MDNGTATSGPPTFSSVLVMGILASLATALRYLAKTQTKAGFLADDYLVAMSLTVYWVYAGVTIWSVFVGGGGLDMHKIIEGDEASIAIYLQVCSHFERLNDDIQEWLTEGDRR